MVAGDGTLDRMRAGRKRTRTMTGKAVNRFPALALLAVLAILAVDASPAAAQRTDSALPQSLAAREYDACMKLARANPRAAHDSALAWRAKGGGNAAMHCIAVSLLGLGQTTQAAEMLAELADQTDATRPALKAGLFGQAASAWILANRPQTAEKLLSDALALQPANAEFLIDRAIARVALKKTWEALDDLNGALDSDRDRKDALTLRASVWRRLNTLELAEKDVTRALSLDPDYPDALLERGLIRKAGGNVAGARADWMKVLEIATTGPLTEAARRNLEIIDVKR